MNSKNESIKEKEKDVEILSSGLSKERKALIGKSEDASVVTKKKDKFKKPKKCEYNNENISVKSSFNKFDALQKRNLIHVRSSDSSKAQEMFSNAKIEPNSNCRLCNKPVYKMEEVIVQFKANTGIYHKSCMRCKDCGKQLKFDNYQNHEGLFYCIVHFKQLFAPKIVQESAEPKSSKTELIIRESQPIELPADVARASDKPDLGLNQLYQLNVRSRFQVFENGHPQSKEAKRTSIGRGNSILTKYRINSTGEKQNEFGLLDNNKDESKGESDGEESLGGDFACSKKNIEKERPIGIGDAMNDIKTRFEKGHMHAKEERREERKQEIQNIRSRLFMGKQAKIKEMYQQAVAESEHVITSAGKKRDVEIGAAAQVIKERFEKGEMFVDNANIDLQSQSSYANCSRLSEDADVFESAISKESRSIFMELDANNASNMNAHNNLKPTRPVMRNRSQNLSEQENVDIDVVKSDTKPEDIKITTADISEKFKFFETYRPNDREKRPFCITPPREGVVKMPTPESDTEKLIDEKENGSFHDNVLQKTQTTSTMLNKFRVMEQNKCKESEFNGLRPLKCFTPPPEDIGSRYYDRSNSEEDEEEEEEDSDENDVDAESLTQAVNTADEALKEVLNAARAKQLRAKFEKWQASEIKRELNEGYVDIYSHNVSDDSTIESAKTIRERFENMRNLQNQKFSNGHCHQVNRFVVRSALMHIV